ncbi:MAG: undecaprenyl-diphosphate phosphatase [Silvanigrellaceae bacterium]|nr:undecaprenyl-diphosphate phosphatase [Silvanigrellaceae bacterium]
MSINHCPTPVDGHFVDCGFANLDYYQIAFLGLVQGITELLPVSSTAHLRVVPSFMGWPDPGTAFTAAMQLASFFAVIIYFKKEILAIFLGTIRAILNKNFHTFEFKLGMGIILGTLPIVVFGLTIKPLLNSPGNAFRSLYVIGAASVVMGLLLILAEKVTKKLRNFNELNMRDCLLVGLAQVLALIPGVSRSGSTITAGLFLGLKRETAAAFSFILGVPAIVGAGLKEIHELQKAHLSTAGWESLGFGLLVGSCAAFIAVFLLMKYIEKKSMLIFAWYRVILGTILVLGTYIGYLK